MDLVAGTRRIIVAMEHATKDGQPKILHRCNLPLTGLEVVDEIITEMALIEITPGGLLLREVAPGGHRPSAGVNGAAALIAPTWSPIESTIGG